MTVHNEKEVFKDKAYNKKLKSLPGEKIHIT